MPRPLHRLAHRTAVRLAACILVACLLAGSLSGYYAVSNLGFESDTASLLAQDLPFQQATKRYRQHFPMNESDLLLAVESATPEHAQAASEQLITLLRDHNSHVANVRELHGGEYFQRNALLFLDPDELSELSNRLIRAQPLLGQLTDDPTLRGLFTMLERLKKSEADDETVRGVVRRITEVIEAHLAGRPDVLSWQRVIHNESAPRPNADQSRELIALQTLARDGEGAAAGGGAAISAIRDAWNQLPADVRAAANLRISGPAAMARDELRTLVSESRLGAPLVLLAVTIILGIGLRSVRLALAALVTLTVGLLITAGLATALVGRLNLISIAFGVLYLGLAVDFAIHLLMRYRIERHRGAEVIPALRITYRTAGAALTLCALTTATGFLAFMPTSFVGVAELGIIAGAGMVVSLLLTLTLLPAMLVLLRDRFDQAPAVPALPRLAAFTRFPARHRAPITLAAVVLFLPAAVLALQIRFDSDPTNLRDPDTEAVGLLQELRADEGAAHWGATVLAQGPEHARELAQRLRGLPEVGEAITLRELIPDQQQDKLATVDELSLMMGMGGQPMFSEPADVTTTDRLASLRQAVDALAPSAAAEHEPPSASAWLRLRGALIRWLEHYDRSDDAQAQHLVHSLEQRLMGTFPLAMHRLEQALAPEPTMPASLARQWVGSDGLHRIQVAPQRIPGSDAELEQFVDAVRAVAPGATGPAVVRVEAGRAIVRAFREATFYALFAITLILLVQLRSLKHTAAVLAPLLLGAVLLVAAMLLLDVPFNFANVIALPLLLGIGVDNGIHMVVRSRDARGYGTSLMATTTARAIVLSAATTLCAFGAMAMSSHPGTASMGQVLTIGLALILLNTLVLLPAILHAPPPPDADAFADRARRPQRDKVPVHQSA